MKFKQKITKTFKDAPKLLEFRYSASKIIFIGVAFLFFLSFFFIGAGFYSSFFELLFSPLYILLMMSLNIYIFFFLCRKFPEKKILAYVITAVSALICFGLSLPIIF